MSEYFGRVADFPAFGRRDREVFRCGAPLVDYINRSTTKWT